MSSALNRIAAGLGRRRRSWIRPLRRLGTAALVVIGAVVFIPGTVDGDPTADISLAAALPIWLLALTWPVWRAPDREAPEGLRWRRRHRLGCRRASVLLLFGSCFGLLGCRYWEWRRDHEGIGYQIDTYPNSSHPVFDAQRYDHFNHFAVLSGGTGLWLLLLSPLPVLLDPLLWQLWPAPVRRAATLSRVAEELSRPDRYRLLPAEEVPAPGFDSDRGWLGRPVPVFEQRPGKERGAPLTIRLGPGIRVETYGYSSEFPAYTSMAWNGRTLVLEDARRRSLSIPEGVGAELVEVRETFRGRTDNRLMLLDPAGRCLLSARDRGLSRRDLARLAHAAGIPFACYELGCSEGRLGSMRDRLFPDAPGASTLWPR